MPNQIGETTKPHALAATPSKISFKEKMQQAREKAIIQAVNHLLAVKGFDLMTVDQVAAEVGIAKASLYKHFSSKEALAAAAMTQALADAQVFLSSLPVYAPALEQLKSVVRWMIKLQLAGEMPTLPSQNSSLRAALMADANYMYALLQVSETIGVWIDQAQQEGTINPELPGLLVLYSLYSRACDPVLSFMKLTGQHSDEQLAQWVLSTCFEGLVAR